MFGALVQDHLPLSFQFFQFHRDFPDMATCGFLHCDFIGQKYICYLLKRAGALLLYRLEKSSSNIPILGKSSSIPAKDAVCLKVKSFVFDE